jgi:hypothetical protein
LVTFHGLGIDQMYRSIEFDGVENLKIDAIDPARAVLTADFSGDGVVDASDLAQWQGDFGRNPFADADTDGDSDGADFLFWQRQLGQGMTLSAGHNHLVVPEPGSLWLLLLGFTTCWPLCRVC